MSRLLVFAKNYNAPGNVEVHGTEASKTNQSAGLPMEEDDVAREEKNDLDMLTTVDDVLLDDELLNRTMKELVIRTQLGCPEKVVAFVVQVIRHRLPRLQQVSPIGFINHGLHGLSFQAWKSIVDMLGETLEQRHLLSFYGFPVSRLREPPLWVCEAFSMLICPVDHPLPTVPHRLWTPHLHLVSCAPSLDLDHLVAHRPCSKCCPRSMLAAISRTF